MTGSPLRGALAQARLHPARMLRRFPVRWVEGEGHTWTLWLSELDKQLAWQAEVLRRR